MLPALALGFLPADPLGQLLFGLIAMAVILLVGRLVLNIAWKLVVVATLVVAAVYTAGLVL